MELDSLKELWRGAGAPTAPPPSSNEQILVILQRKSQSPIAKMKRNLRVEMLIVVCLYSVTIAYYLFARGGRYWPIALMLFLIGLFFLAYYYRKNRLLKQMQCVSCEVRSNLSRQLTTLEKYIRFYFISGTLMTPIAYIMAGTLILYESNHTLDPGSMKPGFWLGFLSIGAVITVAVYYLNIWYVEKLYGRHVKKLKDLLRQMDEAES